ncbi:maltokinase [Streptacidiphilus pinicola]|uniref:Maltokinase n=1 Tax=Streptacidiphilus pinicola TaxID=2219663 RepID=A0A2X0ICW2_9ACTN|nr:maltokinase [Streptacidiphilus pinicola]
MTTPVPPTPATGYRPLVEATLPLLRDWLPRRRWFAGKGHPISAITPLAVTALPGPTGLARGTGTLLHLLLRVEQRQPGGGAPVVDVYQLLLGAHPDGPSGLHGADVPQDAVIGRITSGPHDGLVTYDAAYDPALTRRLLALLTSPQRLGPLRFSTLGGRLPAAAPGRVGTAEQSNTSIIYDAGAPAEAAILKLFRRVAPGLNPDLELSLALGRAGSSRIPAPLAWFEAELPDAPQEAPATLGVLTHFLREAEDGWELALRQIQLLDADPSRVGNFAAESFLLGRATADVHLALARSLPVTVLRRAEVESMAETMALRLDAACLAVPALGRHRDALRQVFRDLALAARGGLRLRAQRVHGDLHLGQVLRSARGWVLLDFEGEPAKTLDERRLPQPAVRDVAGILRSFDYAAAHARLADPAVAATWAARNREAFCAGYAATGAEDPTLDPVLLRAFETDKAVYEVVYEARHRPDWVSIPLAACARLATTTAHPAAVTPDTPTRQTPTEA